MGRKVTWQPFVFGGVASVTAECCKAFNPFPNDFEDFVVVQFESSCRGQIISTFPIDTTKTRLQIQGQTIDARYTQLKYRGMLHAFVRIVQEEGPQALYSGIAPAVLRQATYGTIKIGVYQFMKRLFAESEQDESLPVNVFCGITAGIISSSVANPTDVLKVRMQAKSTMKDNEGMLSAFRDIFHKEGLPGLWRGVAPTAQRAAVVVGVELPAYDVVKKYFLSKGVGDTKLNHFMSSFLAGMAGAMASTPIDVVKTRLMNQRKLKASVMVNGTVPAIYTSSFHCLTHTVRTEGFLALYKGFIPNWLRLGPWNVIFFMTYEQLKKMG